VSERMGGGCGGRREEEINGQRASEVRVCGKARGGQLPSKQTSRCNRGRTSAGIKKKKARWE
jgi:hypothetical protein